MKVSGWPCVQQVRALLLSLLFGRGQESNDQHGQSWHLQHFCVCVLKRCLD